MFARYYADELRRLQDLGAEFGRTHEDQAEFLAVQTKDPDIGRLLQGFAFLVAGLRERLEDDLPELSHTLLQLLYPHYLRTQPAITVVQFEPKAQVQNEHVIPRGSHLVTQGRDGTELCFRTTMSVGLMPFTLPTVRLERLEGTGAVLRLVLKPLAGVDASRSGLRTLRLFLGGGPSDEESRLLYLLLRRNLSSFSWRCRRRGMADYDEPVRLDPQRHVRPVGFETDKGENDPACTALAPFPVRSFGGYRLLQEYFHYEKKFLFLDLDLVLPGGENPLIKAGAALDEIEVRLVLDDVPVELTRVDAKVVRIGCTPVVNLFPHHAHPVQVDGRRSEYLLRPSGRHGALQVYSIDDVYVAAPKAPGGRRHIPELYSFANPPSGPDESLVYYEPRLRPHLREGWPPDVYLRFITSFGREITPTLGRLELRQLGLDTVETLSVDLTCSNGDFDPLPAGAAWRPATNVPGATVSPDLAMVTNILPGTRSVDPPLDQRLHWNLISHLSLNSMSLAEVANLRRLLQIYDFHAMKDAAKAQRLRGRLAALQELRVTPRSLLHKGAPARVLDIELDAVRELDERSGSGFGGAGSLYVFSCVLAQFLRQYAAAGTMARLTVRSTDRGGEFRFPALEGAEGGL